jgi:hypothetical protein
MPCVPEICHCPTPNRRMMDRRSRAHSLKAVSTEVISTVAAQVFS